MQNTLDIIKTRTKRMYLSHPFMWKFGSLYDSMARLIRERTTEYCPIDPFVKIIRDFREEIRIAEKYDFAKLTAHGYRMTRGIPIMDFPDKEFEERYGARKLNMATRRVSSWKKRGIHKT